MPPLMSWRVVAHQDEVARMLLDYNPFAVPEPSSPDADARALRLLRACLNEQQRQELDEHGWFSVTGSRGGRYRIVCRYGWSGNVTRLDPTGHPWRNYCAHGRGQLPAADHFLLQKLTIESNEERFLATAY